MDTLRVALIGIGGFGNQYVNGLLEAPCREGWTIAAVCDPRPEGCALLPKLRALGVLVFESPEALFANGKADLAVISTPIALHVRHAQLAFENGCDVLLEKPLAGAAAEGARILAARDEAGRGLAIGFQWCYDASMRAFKRDVLEGRFGKLLSMKALVLWPRDLAYYARGGGWAGKRFSPDGRPVFDSVASNATAHYIMNMLWLAGGAPGACAEFTPGAVLPVRANDIETFDAIAFDGRIGDARVFYAAAHCVGPEDEVNPRFVYTFERGVARFDADVGDIVVRDAQGEEICSYLHSDPNGKNIEKLWRTMDACRSGDWSDMPCPGEAALAHARAMDAINAVPPVDKTASRVLDAARGAYVLPGLGKALKAAYENGRVPDAL